MFGRNVGRHSGIGDNACHRCGIDDDAASGFHHVLDLIFQAEKYASHVHRHDTVVNVFVLLSQRQGWRQDSCVVESTVQTAEGLHGDVHQCTNLRGVSDVGFYEKPFAACFLEKARPYLEELSRVTGETAVLIGACGSEVLILHSVVSPHALRVAPVAGNFLSIYATAGGKILLSTLHEEAVLKMLGTELKPLTPKTPTLAQLLAELGHIRLSGFAYDFDEHTVGVGAIAVGLQTPQGQYAIDVVGPVWRMEESIDTIKDALTACQRSLSDAMRSIA